jgi:hypothetical protein
MNKMDHERIFQNFCNKIQRTNDKRFYVLYECPEKKGEIRNLENSELSQMLAQFDTKKVNFVEAIPPTRGGKKITLIFNNSKPKYNDKARYIQITYNPYKNN